QLGGHSLLATRLASHLRRRFQVEIPLRSLFEARTLRQQAQLIESALRPGGAGAVLPPILPIPRGGHLPLSFSQQSLWFLSDVEPNSAPYNAPLVVRFRGALDLDVLQRSLGEIVKRHESLRCSFKSVDGRPVTVVVPHREVSVPVTDLSQLAPE